MDNKTKIAILIPHCESYTFLKVCITKIFECHNQLVDEHIYILDDNSQDGSWEKICEAYSGDTRITLKQIKRKNKNIPDVGQLLDEGLKFVTEPYTCMIDADVFPTSKDWLLFPVYLLKQENCSFVGSDTGSSVFYFYRFPGKWENKINYGKYLYFNKFSNNNFIYINNFYRLSTTSVAKMISCNIGFKRRTNMLMKPFSHFIHTPILERFFYQFLKLPANADNGVYANWYVDFYKLGPKYTFPTTGWLGETVKQGPYGQNVLGLIFHCLFSSRVFSTSRKDFKMDNIEYFQLKEAVDNYNADPSQLEHLIDKSKNIKNTLWCANGNGLVQYNLFLEKLNEFKSKMYG